jgi:hypothetical protein
MTTILGALGSVFSVVLGVVRWLSFKRTKGIGKMEAELERRREEDERSRKRRAMSAEISDLDRSAIIERLRKHKR